MDRTELLVAFDALSEAYRIAYMDPTYKRFSAWPSDPWDGLGVFLAGYAFERQAMRRDGATIPRSCARAATLCKVNVREESELLMAALYHGVLPRAGLRPENVRERHRRSRQ